ncbi:MAG: cysteine hydrolase [Firmicutes bacterium]|nr:cysteine hydrolase [Bacillota bacterium]
MSVQKSNKVKLEEINNGMTVIFVVDMVNGFAKKGALSSPRIKKLINPIKKFLEKANLSRHIFVNDNHEHDALEFVTYPPHCHTDEEAAIVDELLPFAKEVVHKNSTNGFFKINQYCIKEQRTVMQHNVNFVIIGCCTDICVLQLALTLKTYFNEIDVNKNIYVIENLVNTFDTPEHNGDEFHNFALELMRNAGIRVVTI